MDMRDEPRRYTEDEIADELLWLQARALRLTADPHGAEDIAADVLLEALERPPRRGSLRGWLATALRHRLLNDRRAADRRTRRERLAERARAVASPAEELVRRERRDAVLAAVRALPPAYRDVVELRYLEGLAPMSIADRLGVSPSTVRTRLARARKRLAKELGGRRLVLLPVAWALVPGRRAYAAVAAIAASLLFVLPTPPEPEPPADALMQVSVTYEVYPTPIAEPPPLEDPGGTDATAAVLPR